MAAALIFAFSLFFIKVTRLYKIMMAVEGEAPTAFNRIGERIKVLVVDVLGQTNVRRKRLPGLAHTLIFFGFLAIQPHSSFLMIQGVFPAFDVGMFFPQLYTAYLFIADILAALVLVGLAYALYRRTVIRPDYLTMGRDANFIILFTAIIVFSFQGINAFQAALPPAMGHFNYHGVFPASQWLVGLFNLEGVAPGRITLFYEICYYIHMGTILGFLVYIPGSKHLHLLAAAPNVFFKRLDREKAIEKSDLENEAKESFGLGTVSALNWKNVLNLYACTECGRCEELCPASATGKPLSPKKMIHDAKVDLLGQADRLLQDRKNDMPPILREESGITDDVLWSCTTCRACEDICPVSIEHLDFVLEMRKYRVLMEADFPTEMQETFNNMENQANPWGFAGDKRAEWCRGMDVPLMADKPEAEVLYFVGCAGSFDDRGQKISRAIARILQKAEVDFAILGPEEGCNGDMARRAGNEYLGQTMIQQNVAVFNQYKPATILTGCPHCFNTLKNEYPVFGAVYPVVHYVDYFNTLIREDRLKIGKEIPETVAYHDSCYLGRWNNIYDAPRDLLKKCLAGQPLEMERYRGKGFCCGAGGARMFMEETIGERINNERAGQVLATGAQTVASACPFCVTMLRDGIAESGKQIPVKDIAEIVDEATD
jgi:Fe-S oxidoreductase